MGPGQDRNSHGRQKAPSDDRTAPDRQGTDREEAGRRRYALSKYCGPRRDPRISAACL